MNSGNLGSLGELIRRLRTRAGLTQDEVASRSGLSVRSLRDLEHDRVRPRNASLTRLAQSLGLSARDLDRLLATARTADGSALVDPAGPDALATWWIGVLGPLSVRRSGYGLTGIPPKIRTVLGLLALRAGEEVSRDELSDLLWAGSPPRTQVNQVHIIVSKVRTLLGSRTGGEDGQLVKVGGGYALRAGPDRSDVAAFLDLIGRAEGAPDTEAFDLLGSALELWRGPVLAGADDRLRQHPAAVTLERRRLEAALALADTADRLGRHARAVTLLRRVADAEPLHEGVHGRLMRALAAAGERGTALRLFAELRTRLIEELGIDPGPALQREHVQILNAADPPSTVVTAAKIPALLPPDVHGFVGRQAELAELEAQLRTASITAMSGTAGAGKTALAVHWAHRVADEFPDGQLYVNLRGFDQHGEVMDPAQAQRRFLAALDVPPNRIPADPDELTDLYRTTVAGRHLLIVLDNARNADQVRPLLPGAPGCTALVTSRNQLTGLIAVEGARSLQVDLLPPAEARDLLGRRLGDQRVAADPEATDRIIEQCAGLPLALSIVAARAATRPHFALGAVAAELDRGVGRSDIHSVFSWSYNALTPAAARLFQLIGLHPGPDLAAPAAASLAGTACVQPLLDELTEVSLLFEHAPGRYVMHDRLRDYAAQLAGTLGQAQRNAAVDRLLDHYLHSARAGNETFRPEVQVDIPLADPAPGALIETFDRPGPAGEWFLAERDVLLVLLRHDLATNRPGYRWQLTWWMRTFLLYLGLRVELAAAAAAAAVAARSEGDRLGAAVASELAALAHVVFGRFDEAAEALRRAGTLYGDAGGYRVGHIHNNLAFLHVHQGRYEQAYEEARRALAIHRESNDPGLTAAALNSVGYTALHLGRAAEAMHVLEQALDLLKSTPRDGLASFLLHSRGAAQRALGNYSDAIIDFRRSVHLRREWGAPLHESVALTDLGDTYVLAGDRDQAREAWSEALSILEALRHPNVAALRERLNREN